MAERARCFDKGMAKSISIKKSMEVSAKDSGVRADTPIHD
jgi:hypothetical protein